MLKQIFLELVKKYTVDIQLAEVLWSEIERNYSDKKRHYHALSHLTKLYRQLTEVREQIKDWDTVLFSMFYHDIIYNSKRTDNEERSAKLAKVRLQFIFFPGDKIDKCISQITATKSHTKTGNIDTDLFTDADLSILGQDWNTYAEYIKQIRKEYSIYPVFIYNPGRKKVVNHFLKMGSIFKTKSFYDKYENQARLNLKRELKEL